MVVFGKLSSPSLRLSTNIPSSSLSTKAAPVCSRRNYILCLEGKSSRVMVGVDFDITTAIKVTRGYNDAVEQGQGVTRTLGNLELHGGWWVCCMHPGVYGACACVCMK